MDKNGTIVAYLIDSGKVEEVTLSNDLNGFIASVCKLLHTFDMNMLRIMHQTMQNPINDLYISPIVIYNSQLSINPPPANQFANHFITQFFRRYKKVLGKVLVVGGLLKKGTVQKYTSLDPITEMFMIDSWNDFISPDFPQET